ncbi:helix-turn-helix domain-containing protein [Embleya sp. NPDC020886]|uniref:helix-turn-helix domain-containing protein n=1 Tax=Embleya sp. NPDC020886 TaxID=3363980 RepID=UPI0037916949
MEARHAIRGGHARWERDAERDPAQQAAYDAAGAAFALGQAVYDRRTELGLSQTALAERAGMHQAAISRVEGGGTMPTPPVLHRLARALQADLNVVFGMDDSTTAVFVPHGDLRSA